MAALSDEARVQLIATASQRQQAAKDYLVKQHQIAEHRLLLCNVKFNPKADAQPVVAISLRLLVMKWDTHLNLSECPIFLPFFVFPS